jgi:hypothetical protein
MSTRPSPCSEERTHTYPTWSLLGCAAVLLGGSAFAQSPINGGVVSGTLSVPGERDAYTFFARNGERFEMRVVDVDGAELEPRIELYNPLGVLVDTRASTDVAATDTRQVTLLGAYRPGTYTLVVSNASSAGSQTGNYELHFVLVPGANAGGELLDGVTVFGTIERGELDSFTFHTEAGQTVEGTLTALHGGTFHMRAEIFEANGVATGIGPTVHFTSTSSPGGLNTIVVSDGSPSAAGTGHYSILLHGVSGAAPYPPSVFWPSERTTDPLLLDNAGHSGLGPRVGHPGEPFNVSIQCTSADAPSVYALMLSLHMHAAALTPWGTSYLDAPVLLRTTGTHAQSVESWFPAPAGLVLPADPALVGVTYTVQGFCGGYGGSMRLSGAVTQTIGS